jgi:hypothetical protein
MGSGSTLHGVGPCSATWCDLIPTALVGGHAHGTHTAWHTAQCPYKPPAENTESINLNGGGDPADAEPNTMTNNTILSNSDLRAAMYESAALLREAGVNTETTPRSRPAAAAAPTARAGAAQAAPLGADASGVSDDQVPNILFFGSCRLMVIVVRGFDHHTRVLTPRCGLRLSDAELDWRLPARACAGHCRGDPAGRGGIGIGSQRSQGGGG